MKRPVLAMLAAIAFGCSSSNFEVAANDATVDADSSAGDSARTDVGAEACADPTFCADKCGLGLVDSCGKAQDCATDCGPDKSCDGVTHKCICVSVSASVWCTNKCGVVKDNCGKDLDCGACTGGLSCISNACGCTPNPEAVTCMGKTCGPATNNCGQTISCGACSTGKACNGGKCCELKAVTCLDKCGSVVNDCGVTVDCGTCGGGLTCCKNTCKNLRTDFANCGACGAGCGAITGSNVCEEGGCTCLGHGSNTDPSSCGPCGSTSMNCAAASRPSCKNGACFLP